MTDCFSRTRRQVYRSLFKYFHTLFSCVTMMTGDGSVTSCFALITVVPAKITISVVALARRVTDANIIECRGFVSAYRRGRDIFSGFAAAMMRKVMSLPTGIHYDVSPSIDSLPPSAVTSPPGSCGFHILRCIGADHYQVIAAAVLDSWEATNAITIAQQAAFLISRSHQDIFTAAENIEEMVCGDSAWLPRGCWLGHALWLAPCLRA